jgi:hypothetical protein
VAKPECSWARPAAQPARQLGYTLSLYRRVTVTFLRPSGSQPEDAEKAPAKAAKGSHGTMIVCKSILHNIYIYTIFCSICVRIGVYIYILCVCMYVYVYVYIYEYM